MRTYQSLAVLAAIGHGVNALTKQGSNSLCNGVEVSNNQDDNCCVGGTLVLSVCDGWPICQGPTTTTQSYIPCATIITMTDSAALSKASASIEASGTSYVTSIAATGQGNTGTVATSTDNNGNGASSTGTASSTSSSATSNNPSAANASPSSSRSSGAAGTMATLVPGGVGAAALLGLAAFL